MILLTAPTSNIGSQVVTRLLDQNASLRLVARDPSQLPADIIDRVEVVQGSHGDPEVIDRAAVGADAAFWLSPTDPSVPVLGATFVDFARPAVDAFLRHDVQRVVNISALGRGTPQATDAGYVTAALELDDAFANAGFAFRAVVNPSFMDNLLRQVTAIKGQGMFYGLVPPERKLPTVATRDIAELVARLLLDDSWTGTDEVPCLGPEDLSPNEQATILSKVLGTPIGYAQISNQAMKDQMTGYGMSDAMAQGMTDMFDAKIAGLDDAVARTDQSRTPTTFEQWAHDVLEPAIEA